MAIQSSSSQRLTFQAAARSTRMCLIVRSTIVCWRALKWSRLCGQIGGEVQQISSFDCAASGSVSDGGTSAAIGRILFAGTMKANAPLFTYMAKNTPTPQFSIIARNYFNILQIRVMEGALGLRKRITNQMRVSLTALFFTVLRANGACNEYVGQISHSKGFVDAGESDRYSSDWPSPDRAEFLRPRRDSDPQRIAETGGNPHSRHSRNSIADYAYRPNIWWPIGGRAT